MNHNYIDQNERLDFIFNHFIFIARLFSAALAEHSDFLQHASNYFFSILELRHPVALAGCFNRPSVSYRLSGLNNGEHVSNENVVKKN